MKSAAPDSALWHLANEVKSWKLHSASARASYKMHEYRRRDCGCAKKEERSEKIHSVTNRTYSTYRTYLRAANLQSEILNLK